MKAAVDLAEINTAEPDQIILENNFAHLDLNVFRPGSLTWGLPDFKDPSYDIPSYMINCACTSASQAIILGTNAIKLGQADAVIAGGANP
jgi:acetyl-CoA acetyltransferase